MVSGTILSMHQLGGEKHEEREMTNRNIKKVLAVVPLEIIRLLVFLR
jgi:hypothetical protein